MNSSTYLVPVSEMASSLVKSYICLHRDAMKHGTIPGVPYLQAVVLASHSGAVQGSPSPRHRRTRTACTKLWSPGPGPAAGRLITNLEQR